MPGLAGGVGRELGVEETELGADVGTDVGGAVGWQETVETGTVIVTGSVGGSYMIVSVVPSMTVVAYEGVGTMTVIVEETEVTQVGACDGDVGVLLTELAVPGMHWE